MLRRYQFTGASDIALPGKAVHQADPGIHRRSGIAAGSLQGCPYRHTDPCRSGTMHRDRHCFHSRITQRQRKPGQHRHQKQQQPGKPLLIYKIEHQATQQGHQITDSSFPHSQRNFGAATFPSTVFKTCSVFIPCPSASAEGCRRWVRAVTKHSCTSLGTT